MIKTTRPRCWRQCVYELCVCVLARVSACVRVRSTRSHLFSLSLSLLLGYARGSEIMLRYRLRGPLLVTVCVMCTMYVCSVCVCVRVTCVSMHMPRAQNVTRIGVWRSTDDVYLWSFKTISYKKNTRLFYFAMCQRKRGYLEYGHRQNKYLVEMWVSVPSPTWRRWRLQQLAGTTRRACWSNSRRRDHNTRVLLIVLINKHKIIIVKLQLWKSIKVYSRLTQTRNVNAVRDR